MRLLLEFFKEGIIGLYFFLKVAFVLFVYRSGSIVSSSIHQYRKESVTILEKAEDEEDEQTVGLPDTVLLLPPQSPASNLPEVKTWVDESAVVEPDVVSGTKPIPRRLSATTNLGKSAMFSCVLNHYLDVLIYPRGGAVPKSVLFYN